MLFVCIHSCSHQSKSVVLAACVNLGVVIVSMLVAGPSGQRSQHCRPFIIMFPACVLLLSQRLVIVIAGFFVADERLLVQQFRDGGTIKHTVRYRVLLEDRTRDKLL